MALTQNRTEANPYSMPSNSMKGGNAMESMGMIFALWDTLMQTVGSVALVVIAVKLGKTD